MLVRDLPIETVGRICFPSSKLGPGTSFASQKVAQGQGNARPQWRTPRWMSGPHILNFGNRGNHIPESSQAGLGEFCRCCLEAVLKGIDLL